MFEDVIPQKLTWTEAQDLTIRRMRSEANTWDHIAKTLVLNRYTVIERGRRLGAERPAPGFQPSSEDPRRDALPPGHPRSWVPITTGTLLDGCDYPLPSFQF